MDNYKITDLEIADLIQKEAKRQESQIMLIASENYVSRDILAAQGSILTNKYAEGYPKKRYYEGCDIVDEIESLAIERLKKLFKVNYANVQPHSGSQANQAVFAALLKPGDKILSMSLNSGGHLTHGSPVNISGKWFEIANYEVDENGLIDYKDLELKAQQFKPKLIICGYSAYPRKLDFKRFRQIADSVGAYLLGDIAHIAGIIAANTIYSDHLANTSESSEESKNYMNSINHENFSDKDQDPCKYCHIVTSTTHKTLRGPRGGIIMTNDEALAKKIDLAIFPGIQGGPLMHVIAAKAISFKQNNSISYIKYINDVLENAKHFAFCLKEAGFDLISGGTDNHLILIDLTSKNITGKDLSRKLAKIGIISNKNCIPFDPNSPFVTSGIRLGVPATTTRGFGFDEYEKIANIINKVCEDKNFEVSSDHYANLVKEICDKFPIY